MSHMKPRSSSNQVEHILAAEARLNRLHRLFKTQFNVTEPSLILEPYLFLGNCISAQDINRLAKLGIRYILNVAIRDVELCPYYNSDIRVLTFDLRDDDRENILRVFEEAFAFIDEAKRNQSRVLVHCSHGQSRSPAIVIGYLMRTYNVSLEQCLMHVIKARPCVLPNDGFLKQLILFDRFLVERRRRREEAERAKKAAAPPPPQKEETYVEPPTASAVAEKPKTPIKEIPIEIPTPAMKSVSNPVETKIEPSTHTEPIHVIPIQMAREKHASSKIESTPTSHASSKDKPRASEKKSNNTGESARKSLSQKSHHRSKLNASAVSNPATPSTKREKHMITTVIGLSASGELTRSHSARSERPSAVHSTATAALADPWDVIPYSTHASSTPKQSRRNGYITEIYDKASNRFIPMPSY